VRLSGNGHASRARTRAVPSNSRYVGDSDLRCTFGCCAKLAFRPTRRLLMQSTVDPPPSSAQGPNSSSSAAPPITPLTQRQRQRGKRLYFLYGAFNSFSYPVLADNVVTLVLLRLGGDELWVGATSALL